jgi:hypothetical protein
MSKEIREMIDKVKYLNQTLNENVGNIEIFKNELVNEAKRVITEINNISMVEVECDTKIFGVIKTKLKNLEIYSNTHCIDKYLGVEGLLNPNNYNKITQDINTVQKTYGVKLFFENGDEMVLTGSIIVIGENKFKSGISSSNMDNIYVTKALYKKFDKMSMEEIIKQSYSQLKLKSIKKEL